MEAVEIKKLDENVINRIAAGEVIQRPANALKEMIENSLDAKSTNIQVTVTNGGLKLLQIQDNGIGIRKEDFNIVCERFTTSKLQQFDDLQTISTYGFRGEALASISHIAHLSITSKTAAEICAYKADFVDGVLQGNAPTPIAGNQGTTITVEDLFFNMNVRRRALRSPAEEYQKISDVVGKYAIHNCKVGFGLKKTNESNDIRTMPNSTCIDNIRTIYGNSIAKELIEFTLDNELPKFKVNGYFSNANYNTKKFNFLLFINNRLVDNQNLKRCLDQVYSTYLPKGTHPFVYMSLELDPTTVDVNVHPTKHEVHFLNEEQIVQSICTGLETKLLGSNNSRTFYTQSKLPGVPPDENEPQPSTSKEKVDEKNMVRTDSSTQTIEKFYGAATSSKQTLPKSIPKEFNLTLKEMNQGQTVCLRTVNELCKAIEDDVHWTLREIFAEHVFVGCIDPQRTLIQYGTKLFLCNTQKILNEFFYQWTLFFFGSYPAIRFSQPLSIYELAREGLDQPEVGWTVDDGDKEELAQSVSKLLVQKAEMLNEYFAMDIDSEGNLKSLPILIPNYFPRLCHLPMFVVRLATEVDWLAEKECFRTFARELAFFYCKMNEETAWEGNDWKWITQHAIYPVLKDYFIPPTSFTGNASILQIADLPKLYKVFERC